MRWVVTFGAVVVGATILSTSPASAAVSVGAVARDGSVVTQQTAVQPVYWRWHGRRYWHRRWVHRHGWRRGYWRYW